MKKYLLSLGLLALSLNAVECKDGVCLIGEPHEEVAATVTELTSENFNSIVLSSEKPVIVDFCATWCGPCKAVKPMILELAQEEKEWVFVTADVDKVKEIAAEYGVRAMPTFIVFKNGEQWGTFTGAAPKEELRQKISDILQSEKQVVVSQANNVENLIAAIAQKDIKEIEKLITEKIDVNGSTEGFPTGKIYPLQFAVVTGSEEIANLLMKAGAKMDQVVEDTTRQHLESFGNIYTSSKECFELAKQLEVQPAIAGHAGTFYEFMEAFSNPEALAQYLENGVDANGAFEVGPMKVTPLYIAIMMHNKIAIEVLVKAGASLSVEIEENKTLEAKIQEEMDQLEQAVARGQQLFTKILAEKTN